MMANYLNFATASASQVAKSMGKTGRAAAAGAIGGGLYGGTFGRDPGQSRLGGAFTGALGGAGLAAAGRRYGGAALRGATGAGANKGFRGILPMAGGAGKFAFARMRSDAKKAYRYIGNTAVKANAGFNKFRGI